MSVWSQPSEDTLDSGVFSGASDQYKKKGRTKHPIRSLKSLRSLRSFKDLLSFKVLRSYYYIVGEISPMDLAVLGLCKDGNHASS